MGYLGVMRIICLSRKNLNNYDATNRVLTMSHKVLNFKTGFEGIKSLKFWSNVLKKFINFLEGVYFVIQVIHFNIFGL